MGSHPLNLTARFVLELGALAGLAWWGSTLGDGWVGVVAAVELSLIAAAAWGIFNVPGDPSRSGRAPVPVPGWVRLLLELAVLTAAAIGWFAVGASVVGIILATAVVVHYAVSYDRISWLLSGANR